MITAILVLIFTYFYGFIMGWISKSMFLKAREAHEQAQQPKQPACPPHDWAADKGRLVCQKCKQVAIDLQ